MYTVHIKKSFLEKTKVNSWLYNTVIRSDLFVPLILRDGPLFFWRGGGMKNIEKNCLQGLKNKLFANIICIKKIVCIEVRETFF